MRRFALLVLATISTPAMAEEGPIGDWRVERLDGRALVAGSTISLRFAEGRLSGKACNNFGAGFTVDGDSISFGETMATRMACARPIMTQEQRMLALLHGPVKWTVSGDRLTLANIEGGTLTARRRP